MKFWTLFRLITGIGFVLVIALALWSNDAPTERNCLNPANGARCMPTIR